MGLAKAKKALPTSRLRITTTYYEKRSLKHLQSFLRKKIFSIKKLIELSALTVQ
jgi:hypothetical protein